MPSADPGARSSAAAPADVERWLTDLGLEPIDRAERDGITSWDLVLDGRRRFDLRVTVILDSALLRHESLNFHPLENTATTTIAREDFLSFLRQTGHEPRVLGVSGDDPAQEALESRRKPAT